MVGTSREERAFAHPTALVNLLKKQPPARRAGGVFVEAIAQMVLNAASPKASARREAGTSRQSSQGEPQNARSDHQTCDPFSRRRAVRRLVERRAGAEEIRYRRLRHRD